MERLRVAVIFGGRSVEHEVSIVTAHQVMAILSTRHEVVPVYLTREGRWLSSPGLNDLSVFRERRWDAVGDEVFLPATTGLGGLTTRGGKLKGSRLIPIDVVIPSVHGTFGEDGTLQGVLELADLPYAGSGVTASAVGMDKPAMKATFRAAGLPVVDDLLVDGARLDEDEARVLDDIESTLGYPAFVKPARLGSSVGIGKGIDRSTLAESLSVARRYDGRILVERALEGCIEINCSVLGGPRREPRVSVCEQPLSAEQYLSFADKYLGGGKGATKGAMSEAQKRRIPAPISDEITKQVQENALAAFKAIDAAGVARIDSFVKESTGETWVMEINTVPGSFSFYLWEPTGLTFAALLDELIDIAMDTHKARSELLFTFESGMLDGSGEGHK